MIHRADRISVTDIRFNATGACKYSVYFCDVTEARAERCRITSTSDGVHVTGPASKVTVRDIIGSTDDDLVSFTGRDYTVYELTAGGGDISDVLVERIVQMGGSGTNTVKLLPGLGKTLSGAVIRNISGTPDLDAIILLSDPVNASTAGGTIKGVIIDGVTGTPGGMLVDVSHPDVQALTIRNVIIHRANQTRSISFNTSGTHVVDVTIDGLSSDVAHTGSAIHIGSNVTVDRLKVMNVNMACGAGGVIVANAGAIGVLQMTNIAQAGGSAMIYTDAGTCPLVSVEGMFCTAGLGVSWSANAPLEIHLSGVTATPSNGRLVGNYSATGTVLLRGNRIVGTATTHVYRSAAQTMRAVGAEVRADVSTLTPVAGDIAFNTNAALACGTGPVISNGALWKHLYTGATT